jgi:DNA-binding transcriptional MerR regulator
MEAEAASLSIEELAAHGGVPVRTVRYYIAEGLLPGPGARGKGAAYGQEHLLRLRLIRRLAAQRVPLAEMRDRLARLSYDDVRALLDEEERRAAELRRAAHAPSPRDYVSALLHRAREARRPPGVRPAPPSAGFADAAAAPAAAREAAAPAIAPPAAGSVSAAATAPAVPTPPYAAAPPVARAGGAVGASRAALRWRRMELAPGVELHVREDAEQRQRDVIARVLAAAGDTGGPSGQAGPGDHGEPVVRSKQE